MAFAHENAAHSDQRSCSKAPFFGSEQTCDSHIATSLDLTVGLDNNTTTEIVENKCLMSLCKTQLPWKTSVLDTSPSRSTGTTIVARDEDVVSLGLGDTGSDDTNTCFGDKLD